MSNLKSRESYISRVSSEIEVAQEVLKKFTADLDADPVHTFKWADNAMHAAATIKFYSWIKSDLENEKATLEQISAYLTTQAKHTVSKIALYPPRSTSAMSNLMEVIEAQVAAEFLDRNIFNS